MRTCSAGCCAGGLGEVQAPHSAAASPAVLPDDAAALLLRLKPTQAPGLPPPRRFEFVEAGAGAPILFDAKLVEPGLTGPASVRRMLDQAKGSGLNLLRMNAFAVDERCAQMAGRAQGGKHADGIKSKGRTWPWCCM